MRSLCENNLYLLEEFANSSQKILLRKTREMLSDIKIFIDLRLESVKHLIRFKFLVKIIIIFLLNHIYLRKKMAVHKVDLKLGTAVAQIFDGSE